MADLEEGHSGAVYDLLRVDPNTQGKGVRVWSGQDEPQGFSLRRAYPTTVFEVIA